MITEEQEKMIVAALQTIVRNDTTRYDHHEARRWDGKTPREAGEDATRWAEPGEIARAALRRLGAPVPDSYLEMVERQKAREAAER
jgi:hypothetical protein